MAERSVESYEAQIRMITMIPQESKPFLRWFEELPGKKDRDKAIYLLLNVGLSPKRVATITGVSRSTIERKMKKGF